MAPVRRCTLTMSRERRAGPSRQPTMINALMERFGFRDRRSRLVISRMLSVNTPLGVFIVRYAVPPRLLNLVERIDDTRRQLLGLAQSVSSACSRAAIDSSDLRSLRKQLPS
ncbi:hypothetical protein SSBR45G_39090 [Bradyrhizobium sp. SSBR45G]|nr:hypothetical protein SSBR45G_39090 [Bradyrhizobium sp. SSBR45G]